jgi:hypothetical protein
VTRRPLLIVLPVLAVLGLAGAWLALSPRQYRVSPIIGHSAGESSPDLDFPDTGALSRVADHAPLAAPTEPSADQAAEADQAREAARAAPEASEARAPARPEAAEAGRGAAAEVERGGGEVAERNPPRRLGEILRAERPRNQTLGNVRPRARRPAARPRGLESASERLRQDRRGLLACYHTFTGNPLNEIIIPGEAWLSGRAPDVTRIDRQVHFPSKAAWDDLPFDLTNFATVWEGFLVIEEEADYWLFLGSDLGGRVLLDGEAVLVNHAMRDYVEVSTVLTLAPGLYPLRIEYFEGRNNSPVSELAACNFMWVPPGTGRPVPVPPEMLLVPEWMWSDNAPIITRLSRNRGAIGDEITIHGQSLGNGAMVPHGSRELWDVDGDRITDKSIPIRRVTVTVAGQQAEILDNSDTSLRIRIPIGAKTGRITVHATGKFIIMEGPQTDRVYYGDSIPSNSAHFTVTTQFGLHASWHNLPGWEKYDFIPPELREPDLQRIERDFQFSSREELDLPFRNNPLACRWEGKLGFPANLASDLYDYWLDIRFRASGRVRVTLDGVSKIAGGPGEKEFVDFDLWIKFANEWGKDGKRERFLPLTIEWVNDGAPALLRVSLIHPISYEFPDGPDGQKGAQVWDDVRVLPSHLFFPPANPPHPPVIRSVRPIWPEGVEPPNLPYDHAPNRPSVREGQAFEFIFDVFGDEATRKEPVSVTVDGRSVTYEVTASRRVNATHERRTARGVLPDGLGEGEMRAKMGLVRSAPFLIDVTNKGLIAYLYDLPNPGGYTQMPDVDPLVCWLIRKDAWINFENANDFDLPFPAETFAIEWLGALIVEEEADYVFTTRSDDGVLFWLDGKLTVEDDNLHYQREKSSESVRLLPGVYPLRMRFFENNVHEVCVLYWQATRGGEEIIPKQVIPKRHYTWDAHPSLPNKTSTYKRADGSDPPG